MQPAVLDASAGAADADANTQTVETTRIEKNEKMFDKSAIFPLFLLFSLLK